MKELSEPTYNEPLRYLSAFKCFRWRTTWKKKIYWEIEQAFD